MASQLRGWLSRGERPLLEVLPRPGYGGALICDTVRAPHQPIGPVSATVLDPPLWTLPCVAVSSGEFADDWPDDPALAWFAEASAADAAAVRLLDHIVNTPGQAGLAVTDRRVAVVTAAKLLAANQPAAPDEPKGLVGKAFSAMGDWLSNSSQWDMGDEVCSLVELESHQLQALSAPLVGRGLPPPELIQLRFQDGSTLWVREPGGRAKVRSVSEQ
jgi:hypothetical protein